MTKMKFSYLFILLLFLLPSLVWSQSLKNENLSYEIPNGFVLGANLSNQENIYLEYIPKNESINNWNKMLTIQVYKGLAKKGISGGQLQLLVSERVAQQCKGSETNILESGIVNSYKYQIWQTYCPLSPVTHKEEFFVFETIDGKDSLYGIQYAFTSDPTKVKVQEAVSYLKTVSVCDNRISGRKCSLRH